MSMIYDPHTEWDREDETNDPADTVSIGDLVRSILDAATLVDA